jgi:hypothetical protein
MSINLRTPAGLAATMCASKSAAQFIAGEQYEDRIAEFKAIIRLVAGRTGHGDIETACDLLRNLEDAGKLTGSTAMWMMAALCEMTEEAIEAEAKLSTETGKT